MEELMYYVWQQRIFSAIRTTDNSSVEIIHPGLRNHDAGPDFFNAKIKIDGMIWAGNIEMHVRASDWFRHNHQNNPTYENVILHVVMEDDAIVRHASGEPIKTVIMQIPPKILERYKEITTDNRSHFNAIRCLEFLKAVPSLILKDWMEALTIQRMLAKSSHISDLTENGKESWQEALYVILCRSLGTGINSDAFERLARSLPYAYLLKHLDNPLQVRALLFGQAGLLPDGDETLQQEYQFLRAKFQLTPLPASLWRMARLRPKATPQVRLEALCHLLSTHKMLHSEILEAGDIETLTHIFTIPNLIGSQTAHSIIINAVIPMLISYGQWMADDELTEKSFALLEQLPAEKNRYTKYWTETGISNSNAFDSQALLQLYQSYCEPHKCINCRIGCWLIKQQSNAT